VLSKTLERILDGRIRYELREELGLISHNNYGFQEARGPPARRSGKEGKWEEVTGRRSNRTTQQHGDAATGHVMTSFYSLMLHFSVLMFLIE
jgi:hypothetical protein